jgi:hypothetical protein
MNKDENIVSYPHSIETRVAWLEMSMININQTLIRIENRFDKFDEKFDKIDNEFKEIRKEMRSDFRWLITVFGGIAIGLAGLIAHGFHWF